MESLARTNRSYSTFRFSIVIWLKMFDDFNEIQQFSKPVTDDNKRSVKMCWTYFIYIFTHWSISCLGTHTSYKIETSVKILFNTISFLQLNYLTWYCKESLLKEYIKVKARIIYMLRDYWKPDMHCWKCYKIRYYLKPLNNL